MTHLPLTYAKELNPEEWEGCEWWWDNFYCESPECKIKDAILRSGKIDDEYHYPAPTIEDFLERLPYQYCDICKGEDGLWRIGVLEAIADDVVCEGEQVDITFCDTPFFEDKLLIVSLFKMFMWLKEEGVI